MAASIYTGPPIFIEIPSRRTVQQFGVITKMTFVYQGLEVYFPNWNPQLGSSASGLGFPLMFLSSIDKTDKGGGLIEVTLTYSGTQKSGANYSDLVISVDLLDKTFSWSGVAFAAPDVQKQVAYQVAYTTLGATMAYTTYKYQDGPIFENLAGQFTKVINGFANISYSPIPLGTAYSGIPTIPALIDPIMTLSRFTCKQAIPSGQENSAASNPSDVMNNNLIWICAETWEMDYNQGSIGFIQVNL